MTEIYIIFLLRIAVLLVMLFNILPIQVREFKTEKNGLKKIKLSMVTLGSSLFVLNNASLMIQSCRVIEGCDVTRYMDTFGIVNAVSTFVGVCMLFIIYNRKY